MRDESSRKEKKKTKLKYDFILLSHTHATFIPGDPAFWRVYAKLSFDYDHGVRRSGRLEVIC